MMEWRALCAGLLMAGAASATLVESRFDANSEGWSLGNDGTNLQWFGAVGNPPGSIRATDVGGGGWWYFVAPAKFLGDPSAAWDGVLSWDLNISSRDTNPSPVADAILIGGGLTLEWRGPVPTAGQWTHRDVALTPAAGWIKSGDGAPTDSEMRNVLANLTALRFRGEYRTGSDSAYLDNVVLTPEPGTLALLGLASMALIPRRKRLTRAS